ncbi:MAG TPA: RNA pseudouridine synthase [Desulfosarcina sp.]|nr:RNA pseudouridine synthase [Desulfosarcina sp.]
MNEGSATAPWPAFFDPRWPVLYVDNHLLAVYKPSGLLVQGDRTGDACLLDLGKHWIKTHCNKPGRVFLSMVHRLDRPVAGVVLFARTSKAAGRLSAQFRERTVEKHYLAVVRGTVASQSGRLVNHIERGVRVSRVVPSTTDASREARLHYRVLDIDGQASLLRISLETGRRHQIRIQLSHAGHPIVGDLRYGGGPALPRRQIALLAHRLSVNHPTRDERIDLTCPIPREWPWPVPEKPHLQRPPWEWRSFAEAIRRIGERPAG